jgi:hypothetical protein
MSIYHKVYENLCQSRKVLKESYVPGSGLHKHHIIPKHTGGKDSDENYTYLTVREHILAHFMLWKMYKNENDLRSMKMLGAKLSVTQRKIVGEWCANNEIGFHNKKWDHLKPIWRSKGIETQKVSGNENTFYFWSTEQGRKKRASMGGKVGAQSQIKSQTGIHTKDTKKRSEWASLGGKSHKGKKCMYRPGDKTFIRVKPEDISSRLNEGYVFGSPYKRKK